ncbi:MAG: ATP-binding protein [Nitrospirae bacterium]|nr:ATP-binding protein [Nitrospirota bacterium]
MLTSILEKLYDKPFASELLYPVFYEDDVFSLQDGSLGLMWEIDGINVDGLSEEDVKKASSTFSNFLKNLPEETPMQIITVCWRGLEDEELSVFTKGDLGNKHIEEYMTRKIQWHEAGKKNGFAQEGNIRFYPKTIKTYFTIKQKPLMKEKLYDRDSYQKTLKKLKDIEMVVNTTLKAGNINHKRIDAEKLIQIMYRVLNPKRNLDVDPPKYTEGDMRKFMLYNSPEADGRGWQLEGDVKFSTISFMNNPAVTDEKEGFYTYPNILFSEINGVSLFDYVPMMVFTINFYLPSQESIKRSLTVKRSFAFLHRFNVLGDTSIDKEIASEETKRLLTEMYSGEKIIKASYHLCIPNAVEESDFMTSQIVSFLNVNNACNAFQEDLIGNVIFMRSLPFGYDHQVPDEERFVKRATTATSAIIADVAPIYRSGRGEKTDVATGWYNRRGESVWLDLFDKKTAITAPHCLITGATGAGKSVATCDFINQALRQPAVVVVIDKGESYNKLSHLYGGQYLKFEGETDFILPPFMGDFSDDHRAFITYLLSTMVTGGHEKITREEVSVISEAVLEVSAQEEKSIGRVVEILKSYNDPVSTSVARKLFPFYGSGQYARFIEGDKPSLQLSNRLTVFELGDVEVYKDLQAVIVFLLIHYVTEYVKKIPGRKYLIIDEAWALFKNEVAVEFLCKAVKTFRKHGCSVIFVTQQLDDFMVIASAINMKDNCPNKVLLYQEGDVVIKNAAQLELNQGTLELYKTIRKSNKYTEALIVAQNWTAVGRITLDPESYWIATTSEPDKAFLKEIMATKNLSLSEAVKYAANLYPYGVPADAGQEMEANKHQKRRFYERGPENQSV